MKVLEALRLAARMFPGLRLGQLLDNVMQEQLPGRDLFYVEDTELANAIHEYMVAHGEVVS